jgi:oligo-alginate lyase
MMTAGFLGEKLAKTTWADDIVNALRQELLSLQAAGSLVIPEEPGGWWHQYVCPEHHTELLFDPQENEPEAIACPYGCRIQGEVYRGAWLVFKHQSLARYCLQAAAMYAVTREVELAVLSKRLLVEYALQFPKYPVHPDAQPWMLKGRAFHQALTEGIWSTTLLRAYLLLLDEGVEFTPVERQALDTFLTMLESSMKEYRQILIHDRNNPENNYTAWLNASLSCVYAVRGQIEELKELIEGVGGFKHHLTIGVKPDQFEFEGSVYYHIFVLRAYMISAEMAERFGIDLYSVQGESGQSLKGMFELLITLANEQGMLPALHDGPMARVPYAREIAETCEAGLARYGLSGLIPILAEAYNQLGGKPVRSSLEALLYGTGEWPVEPSFGDRGSQLLAESGFVIGRRSDSNLSFLADFGPHGGSHGHDDKLHVSLAHRSGDVTPDMGMVPYGSELRKQWFAKTASHNTVSIGGATQAHHTGRCVRFENGAEATIVWLQSTDAYSGCQLDRHLLLKGDVLVDWFEVELQEAASIEWWMHPTAAVQGGKLQALTEEAAAALLQPIDGGAFMHVTGRYTDDRELYLRYTLASGAEVYHTALVQAEDEVYQIETPGTTIDPSQRVKGLLHRRMGRTASFIHVYTTGEQALLKLRDSGEITVTSGNEQFTIALSKDSGLTITGRG